MLPIRIIARCKTLTPALCGGVAQEGFELRTPAIKGQLRFWYRAFQSLDEQKLFQQEAALFGSTTNKSRISLTIDLSKVSLLKAESIWPDEFPDGLKYFLFPIIKRKQKLPRETITCFTRELARPGLEFILELRIRKDKEQKEDLLDVLSALWLFENFGGIGARTRRGLGSFKIQTINIYQGEKDYSLEVDCPLFKIEKRSSPEEHLKGGLAWIQKRWGGPKETSVYTSLSSQSSLLILKNDLLKTPMDLLGKLGETLREYRNTYPWNEAKMMHNVLTAVSNPSNGEKFLKPGIGLPITYRFKENFGKVKERDFRGAGNNLPYFYKVMGERGSPEDEDHKLFDRRSSPLLFSIHQWRDNLPYATALLMPAPLLPDNTHLAFHGYEEIKNGKGRREERRQEFDFTTPVPDVSFARAVLNHLGKAFGKKS